MINELSPEWGEIEEYLQSRLDSLRSKNDANLDLYNTALVRGQIKEIKKLLKLPMNEVGGSG